MSTGRYIFRGYAAQAWQARGYALAGAGGSVAFETQRHVLYGTSLERHTLHGTGLQRHTLESTSLERHSLSGATP